MVDWCKLTPDGTLRQLFNVADSGTIGEYFFCELDQR